MEKQNWFEGNLIIIFFEGRADEAQHNGVIYSTGWRSD